MGRCQHAWFGGIASAALSLGGCQGPETPVGPTARSSDAPLEVRCSADATLTCTAQRFGKGDPTAQAQWFATDVIGARNPIRP